MILLKGGEPLGESGFLYCIHGGHRTGLEACLLQPTITRWFMHFCGWGLPVNAS